MTGFRFSIKSDVRDYVRHLKHSPKVMKKAQTMALNKTMAKVKTGTIRDTAKAVGIKQKFVRQRVYFKGRLRARTKSLEAVLLVKHPGIPITEIGNVVSTLRTRRSAGGLKVGKHRFPNAFVQQVASGKWLAFQRKGRSRYPIEELRIQLIPHANRSAQNALVRIGKREYPVELNRAMRYLMSKMK